MKSINRKLNELENCVLNVRDVDLTTTQIAYECLSEPEQKIMDKAYTIGQYWDRERDLTEFERTVLEKAGQILNMRINYLFRFNLQTLLCEDDSYLNFIMETRLLWFIDQLINHIHTLKEENRICDQKGKSWKVKEKEIKELFKDYKEPYTKESFEEFMKPVFKRMRKDLKKKKKKKC
jgi:hypothetical protein